MVSYKTEVIRLKNKTIQKISLSALFTALIFVATYFIAIPMPAIGYVNLGDAFILIASLVLGPIGAICAGVGSALADLMLGYAIYAPATLVIKSSMAIACYFIYKGFSKFSNRFISIAIGAIVAELIMILGYLVFEWILYGFAAAVVNILFNAIQGGIALVVSYVVVNILFANKSAMRYISSLK